jgi:hypothetical protein
MDYNLTSHILAVIFFWKMNSLGYVNGRAAYAAHMIKHKTTNPPHDQKGQKVARISYPPISEALCQKKMLS